MQPVAARVESAAPSGSVPPKSKPKAAPIHFVEALDSEFICPFCQGPLIDPVRGVCSHEYCRRCANSALQDNSGFPVDCPEKSGCRGTLSKATLGEAPKTVRLMQKLKVYCVHEARGCPWIGAWSDLLKHVENHCALECVKCPFPGCGKGFERAAIPDHKKQCKYRSDQCRFCLRTVKWCDLALHETKCDLAPTECPQLCGETVQQQCLESHIEKECPNTVISCPFGEFGCSACGENESVSGSGGALGHSQSEQAASSKSTQLPGSASPSLRRKELEAHLNDGVHDHLTLLIRAIREERMKHRREVAELKAELSEYRSQMQADLRVGNSSVADAVSTLSTRVLDQQRIIEKLTSGASLTVDLRGCGNFISITEALANCNAGDLILVRPGRYKESFSVSKPNIWIYGAGPTSTIIETSDSPIRLLQDGIVLASLRVETESRTAPAIHCSKHNHCLMDCSVQAAMGSAVVVASGAPVLKRCKLSSSGAHALWWKSAAVPGGSAVGCTFSDSGRANVVVEGGGELSLEHCELARSTAGNGLWVHTGSFVKLQHCQLHHNAFSNVDVINGGSVELIDSESHHSLKFGLCVAEKGKAKLVRSQVHANALPNVLLLAQSELAVIASHIHHGDQQGFVAKPGSRAIVDGQSTILSNALENTVVEDGAKVVFQAEVGPQSQKSRGRPLTQSN
jgi:hypothetical protein